MACECTMGTAAWPWHPLKKAPHTLLKRGRSPRVRKPMAIVVSVVSVVTSVISAVVAGLVSVAVSVVAVAVSVVAVLPAVAGCAEEKLVVADGEGEGSG